MYNINVGTQLFQQKDKDTQYMSIKQNIYRDLSLNKTYTSAGKDRSCHYHLPHDISKAPNTYTIGVNGADSFSTALNILESSSTRVS